MDCLLIDSLSGVPEKFELSCYYVVDNHLRYISMADTTYFYLHYVDSYVVGQKICESKNEYDFDAYVFNHSKPILNMNSLFENLENRRMRVVSVKTYSGNPISRKPKKSESANIMTRYINNNKKLF